MQPFITILVIALAGSYVAWRCWRTWRGTKSGCGGGCGCSKSAQAKPQPTLIAPEELTLRRRSGSE